MPLSSRRSTARRFALGLAAAVALWSGVSLLAQIPGRNVNMVAGTEWPGGDPFLQRQNEPSMAASTRNPLHLVAGSNDYRTVDLPGLPDAVETGDAWVSVYKSFDGGARWSSTLMPGYPQDTSAAGLASPLKGYQAAADPVVRAGVSGLVFYNGLVFDRGENGKSGIFVARFIDRNNQEAGDSIAYLGASMVATSPDGAVFLDKPWMVVDIPRGNANLCAVGGTATGTRVRRNGHRSRGRGNGPPIWVDPGLQYVEAGPIYVGYTAITGEGSTLQSQIFVKRSLDCGATWSQAMRVSQPADRINQGLSLAISPLTGDLFAAWRRFSASDQPDADAVMVSRLRISGASFDAPGRARGLRRTGPVADALDRIFEHRQKRRSGTTTTAVDQIDQNTGPFRFRTNAYPTLAVDGAGRAYVAWSERGFASIASNPETGEARIVIATTTDGRTVSPPVAVDEQAQSGHQLMPSLTFAGGKLMLVFYDQRETSSQLVGTFVDDAGLVTKRNTIDIRASLGTPGATPSFAPSVRVSDYLIGSTPSSTTLRQLQFNPPNLPMFRLGTVPFIGDYIDVAPSPAFVPTASGEWVYNTASTGQIPLFHAVWTDNRDVRPPRDGNWANYTPPNITFPTPSLFDPTQQVAQCQPGAGNAGSRNQNIYTARIGGGLLVGSPGNSKQLSPTVQRGFVVFAQNQTTVTKTFRMQVMAQPPGGRASFEQFPLPPYTASSPLPLTFVDVSVPARSTASRTVYATSTDPRAQIAVNVSELAAVGGATVPGGLAGRTVLNPDIENPDIENPDIENPDIENPDIENAEVYNPDIENPDIENPDIENPDIENPDIENPDIENPDIENPDIENIVVDNTNIANPDIENPDIENPDIENPDIENPDIENGTISDVTWSVTNIGNTTSAFNVNVFLAAAGVPDGINTQLIVYKTYKTPVLALDGCSLKTETRNVVLFNVPSPSFITPGVALPDQNDPSEKNATLWLNPGEVGRVTLRVYDNNRFDNVIVTNLDGTTASIDPRFNPATVTTVGISAQGVDVLDPPGATEPPAVTTTGTNLFFLQQPTSVAPGALIAPPVRVRVWDNTGAPLPGVTVSIALENAPSGVLLSGTTSAVANVDGIATFGALSVNLPATGLRLRATATSPGAVAAGTSAPFNVVAITPSFVQPPTAVNVGAAITPPVSVRVTDNSGAVVPGVQVALTLLTSAGLPLPGGVTLTGATPVLADAGGIATFAALSVNQPGTYVLRATATAPGLVGAADSASFPVSTTTIPAQVFISNTSSVFNNGEQSVSVSTNPEALATTVTYNGSETPPTAIGAYNVVATVTAPGYAGSATAVKIIASTPAAGGSGGGAYPPTGALGCGPGVFANGVRAAVTGSPNEDFGDINYALTSGQLLCSNGVHPGQFGGTTTPNLDLTCDPGLVMVGIFGTTGGPTYNVVTSVGARCQSTAGGDTTPTATAPTSGVPSFAIDCPAGQAVTGVVGGQGAVVDSIALVCAPVPPPPTGSNALWSADGNTVDSLGGNNGTLQGGAGYTMGRIGPGFSFSNPVSLATPRQFVQVPDSPGLQMTTAMTMSAWIYPTSNGVGSDAIIINKEGEYEIGRFPDGSIGWAFASVGGASYAWVAGTPPGAAPINTWTHVAVTYNGGTVVTYVNGTQVSSIAGAPTPIGDFYPSLNELWIGGRQSFALNPEWFDGRIDEIGIQNRALTPVEVLALYNEAQPQLPESVALSGVNDIFNEAPRPVTVTSAVPTVTLYNSSTTVPSAIGAYYVQAIVNQNGYAGAASVTHKIASTPSAGGNGGLPYERYCGSGVFASGIAVSPSNESLWNAQLRCSDGGHPPNFGNTDTPPYNTAPTAMSCQAGEVMVGLTGSSGPISWGGDFVIAVAPRCQEVSGGTVTDPFAPLPGSAGGTSFSLDCPAGQAVRGVVGGAGSVVDSVALVCGTLPVAPPAPTITSVAPTTLAAFQYVTILGTNLPATSMSDVLFSQGGPEYASDYVWTTGPSMVIARVPSGVLANGPATVRLKNPANTVTTAAYSVTISGTPGPPALLTVYNAWFGGSATSTLNEGQQFLIEADGTGSAGTTFYWTREMTTISQAAVSTTGGPTGRVGTQGTVPLEVTAGVWTLTVTTNGSAPSNGISITVNAP